MNLFYNDINNTENNNFKLVGFDNDLKSLQNTKFRYKSNLIMSDSLNSMKIENNDPKFKTQRINNRKGLHLKITN